MNSITKRYISWEKFADQIGTVALTKESVKQIFDKLDKTSIIEVASDIGSTIPREFLLLTYGNTSFENILSMLEIWSSRYGCVKHDIDHHHHRFSVVHGMSSKFSLFYCNLLEAMAKDLSFTSKVVTSNPQLVSFDLFENT